MGARGFWRCHGFCSFAAAACSLAVSLAHAQIPAVQDLEDALKVDAAATCLDKDTLIEHVASRLGTTQVDARVSVGVHGSPQFARVVWFRIEHGAATLAERRFEPGPARCEDLHAAIGLAIALAIKAAPLDTVSGAAAIPRAARGHETRPWAFGVDGLGSYAVVPNAAFGAGVQLQRALIRSLVVRLGLIGIAGPDRTFAQTTGGFDAWLMTSRLDACNAFGLSARLQLSVCLGLALGGIYIRGHSLPSRQTELGPFAAVAGALDLTYEMDLSWSVHAALSVMVPVKHTRVVVRNASNDVVDANELAVAGGFVSVGPMFRF